MDPYQFGIGCTINIYHHTCSKMFDMPQNNNIILERDQCCTASFQVNIPFFLDRLFYKNFFQEFSFRMIC